MSHYTLQRVLQGCGAYIAAQHVSSNAEAGSDMLIAPLRLYRTTHTASDNALRVRPRLIAMV